MSTSAGWYPGQSLQLEYERRKNKRETRVQAFAVGAEGERRIAESLEQRCGGEVLFLHNRRLGTGKRNGDIDHIAIGPSGVFVVDAKSYQGKAVRVRRTGGLIGVAKEQLMIAGRDRTNLLGSLERQLAAVRAVLPDVPVVAMFCFVDADLPLFGRLKIQGLSVNGPKSTAKRLMEPGPIGAAQRQALRDALAADLPPAIA